MAHPEDNEHESTANQHMPADEGNQAVKQPRRQGLPNIDNLESLFADMDRLAQEIQASWIGKPSAVEARAFPKSEQSQGQS